LKLALIFFIKPLYSEIKILSFKSIVSPLLLATEIDELTVELLDDEFDELNVEENCQ
jgi:hypothetical protein